MSFLDPITQPLLAMPPFWSIFIIALLISLVITIIYKYMTNQPLMKSLKEEIKKYQQQMKKEKDNPTKMLAIQKKAMDANMKYMMESFKPTLVTFIPIILVFGWLSMHFAAEPIVPGSDFFVQVELRDKVYGSITFDLPQKNETITLKDSTTPLTQQINNNIIKYELIGVSSGTYTLGFTVNNSVTGKETQYPFDVVIHEKEVGKESLSKFNGKDVKKITISYPKKKVLNIFGFELGWLGTYIILSILFSIGLRKAFALH